MFDTLGPLQNLLEGLQRGTGFTFEIWEAPGDCIYSTQTNSSSALTPDVYRALQESLKEEGGPATHCNSSGDVLYGLALRPSGGKFGFLVAFENMTEAPEGRATASADAIKDILTSLKPIIEDRISLEEEAQKLTQELENSYEDLNLFSRIATHVKTLQFSRKMLESLIVDVRGSMRVDIAAACLVDRSEFNVTVLRDDWKAGSLDTTRFVDNLTVALPKHAPEFGGDSYIVNDSTENPILCELAEAPYRTVALQIRQGDRVFGLLILVSFNMDEIFRRGEHQLLSAMAEQIGLVIANTDLYRDLEIFVVSVVRSLITAIEAKDVYTRGHSERVCNYSLRIAEVLGLSDSERGHLQWAAILHDVGKIGTLDEILMKPDRLTDEEFAAVKMHPVKGAEILRPLVQLEHSLPGVLYHHERMDGSGYPEGLRGDQIPMQARIIGVADTFDAMTSNRAYRMARSQEQAIEVLTKGAGELFDRDVIAAFAKVLQRDMPWLESTMRATTVSGTERI